jgi:hypothetical protein
VAIGDLNGDGKPDLVLASRGANAVSVLLGDGSGNFGVQRHHVTGLNPFSVAMGDLNRDGKLDLVVAEEGHNSVLALLGNGDGSFVEASEPLAGSNPYSVAVGDLNGDGKPDLAVANSGSNSVSVLLGNGDGTFMPKVDYATGNDPVSVAIGDLNGDGKPDLVVTNAGAYPVYGNTVSVLLGDGEGNFGPKSDFGTGDGPVSVAIGDLNGDGKLDLAVANDLSNTVSVLLGKGDGTFGAKTDYSSAGEYPLSVAIGDLNGDGKPDLAVANYGTPAPYSKSVSVLLGNGDGRFGVTTSYGAGTYANGDLYCVSIGDFNGDGKPDLVVANTNSNTVSVLLGSGDGTFPVKTDYGTENNPVFVAIGDLNGDGRPDLAVANSGSNSVSVLLNAGSGIPTPITLALVDAHVTPGHVELRWYGVSMAGVAATVYRQAAQSGWSAIASIAGDGTGTLRFEDASVQAGASYGYRLGVREGGVEKFYGETWLSVPGLALALEGLRPNPAVGEPVASFTLSSGSSARLELLDVTGRVWLTRAVGDLGAGSHLVRLGKTVPAGMYWLRLTQSGRSLLARGVVVR